MACIVCGKIESSVVPTIDLTSGEAGLLCSKRRTMQYDPPIGSTCCRCRKETTFLDSDAICYRCAYEEELSRAIAQRNREIVITFRRAVKTRIARSDGTPAKRRCREPLERRTGEMYELAEWSTSCDPSYPLIEESRIEEIALDFFRDRLNIIFESTHVVIEKANGRWKGDSARRAVSIRHAKSWVRRTIPIPHRVDGRDWSISAFESASRGGDQFQRRSSPYLTMQFEEMSPAVVYDDYREIFLSKADYEVDRDAELAHLLFSEVSPLKMVGRKTASFAESLWPNETWRVSRIVPNTPIGWNGEVRLCPIAGRIVKESISCLGIEGEVFPIAFQIERNDDMRLHRIEGETIAHQSEDEKDVERAFFEAAVNGVERATRVFFPNRTSIPTKAKTVRVCIRDEVKIVSDGVLHHLRGDVGQIIDGFMELFDERRRTYVNPTCAVRAMVEIERDARLIARWIELY